MMGVSQDHMDKSSGRSGQYWSGRLFGMAHWISHARIRQHQRHAKQQVLRLRGKGKTTGSQPGTGARTTAAKVRTARRSPGLRDPPASFVLLGPHQLSRPRKVESKWLRRQTTSKVVAGNRSVAAYGILSQAK